MTRGYTEQGGPGRRSVLAGLAAASLALTGCGEVRAASARTAPRPSRPVADGTVIMIIRHGEKPDKHHPGIGDDGRPDPKSLTARGWQRARALPSLFDPPAGHTPPPGIHRPRTVYAAADTGPHAGAHRMRQTVTPLARHLGLPVLTTYAETRERALAAAASTAAAPVLICWEHSRIPDIVAALGASDSGAPKTWPDRFDLVWVLTRRSGAWSFREVDQHLLPGDR
ncbi:hypothetical protein [Streptantibioticus cattleyicolor]|nr:hypothetical protein [Streptantibioticus cattleyicolor]CCB72058.1 conserved exported protein of unknown function [Streptantibioticus cattleyicolor NRRL 8057 = DSM 46488]